ncbi:MAG: NFACT family protein [Candidatus Micrarchaeota archaeon]
MHIMSAFEYSFVAKELSGVLAGNHFNRMRRMDESTYRLKIGSEEVLCELGVRIHATRFIEPPAEAGKFAQKVEKELDNARLLSIEQINQDRILSFVFDKGSLVFEMFGKGNAILVRDGTVIAAHRYESWSDREIKAGSPYKPPKPPARSLEPSGKYIIVSLVKLPLGKEYSLEALARAGVDEKTPGASLDKKKLASIEAEVERIRKEASPIVFYKDGKPVGFSLTSLSSCESLEVKRFPSLSEAADAYYSNVEEENPELEKLRKRLEQQKERLAALHEEQSAMRKQGDAIYQKYPEVESLIAMAKKGDIKELEKRGAKIDKKEKSIEMDL